MNENEMQLLVTVTLLCGFEVVFFVIFRHLSRE